MKYYVVLDIKSEQAFLRIPAGEGLEFAKEMVELLITNPILHVLGIVDENNNVVLEINDFTRFLNTF